MPTNNPRTDLLRFIDLLDHIYPAGEIDAALSTVLRRRTEPDPNTEVYIALSEGHSNKRLAKSVRKAAKRARV